MHMRRPSPASIIASVALFFALGGTAIAAHQYLITSTKQIKPSVLKKLKGNVGKTGATGREGLPGREGSQGKEGKEGSQGKEGKEGSQGKEGKEGPFAGTLPSGKTTTGAWAVRGEGLDTVAITAISFSFPLASRPTVHVVPRGGSPPSGCSGSVVHPGASPGNLCIFEGFSYNVAAGATHEWEPASGATSESGFTGATLYATPEKSSEQFEEAGTFAVTAP